MAVINGYMLIADISGYTAYLTTTELEHANPIILSLLKVLVEHMGEPLELWRLEGDAVMAYSTDEAFPSGETFLTICETLYNAFSALRLDIQANTDCPCRACAQVPGMGDISRSQLHISDSAFGSYMRLRMKAVDCDKPGHAPELAGFVATLQGADPQAVAKAEPPVNAWLWFEYDLIAFGAGWLDGASWVYKGDPRPPLCHYPAE